MAYTFGGGTGDDILCSLANFMAPGSGQAFLITGWWRPTTLTAAAGRGLWSAGSGAHTATIDTTTSELRLKTDNATTDGEWTTSGVGLATDTWSFLAFLLSTLNGTPSAAWRVWAGTLGTPPVAVTVTNAVAPSGNFTGSTQLYLGNVGTGTLAFQGDIDAVSALVPNASASATLHPFGVAAFGAVSAGEEQFIYNRFVLPAWHGFPLGNTPASVVSGNVAPAELMLWDGLESTRCVRSAVSATNLSFVTPTVSGATVSATRCPRPALINGGPFSAARRR